MARITIEAGPGDRLPLRAQVGLRTIELWGGEAITINVRAGESVFIVDEEREKPNARIPLTVWGSECPV